MNVNLLDKYLFWRPRFLRSHGTEYSISDSGDSWGETKRASSYLKFMPWNLSLLFAYKLFLFGKGFTVPFPIHIHLLTQAWFFFGDTKTHDFRCFHLGFFLENHIRPGFLPKIFMSSFCHPWSSNFFSGSQKFGICIFMNLCESATVDTLRNIITFIYLCDMTYLIKSY